ncbi:ABC-type glycerol-3-phosphate transport system substrate-binding protein [Alicyclobacillus sacchari]|uniref:ABC-type glycerol-3-phosphate transport system substrate-binding protein n=1 Tax=Alicyclobacillus sacchari TaxID=392010 RepID=A0A4R8LRG8_9BACL|nr:ABC transporter substrate-binding protein [Alicyclobacillus sacchari]TDY49682.1 ABC-type glycerol-3-phosphate transport system substrate-binding protein [Alicyclobacillus sacchari]GMA58409.1 sugar ABC transporter substrate-binding protein [Alicyclobacillus sacchari]
MKKWVAVVSITGVSALALAGCGTQSVSKPDTNANQTGAASQTAKTITVLTNRTDMQANGMLQKYSEEFAKTHPGITVKWQTFVDNSTVQAQMNGGTYPDVMLILPNITPNELPQFFVPLDNLGLDNKIYFKDFQSYNGHVYGIPTFGDVNGIVYNKTAFKKAGITSVPTTLNEFYADCAKLKKAGIIPIALNYTAKWPLANWTDTLPDVIAGNPNYLNTIVNNKAPFSSSAPMGQALNIVHTIVKNGWAEPDWKNTNWANSKTMEAQGKVAMMYLGQWAIPQIVSAGTSSSNVGFFPFPATNHGKPIAIMTPDWELAVNKHSKNIPAAEAFVKWMVLESGYPNYAGGLPPVKGMKSNVPQIQQLYSQAKVVQGVPSTTALTQLENNSQIDINGGGAVQTVLNAQDFATALQQFNQQWANAASLSGQ